VKSPKRTTASRPEFDSRLNSYSKAALAVAAVGALTATDAAAQAIVNLTRSDITSPTGDLDNITGFFFNIGPFHGNQVSVAFAHYSGFFNAQIYRVRLSAGPAGFRLYGSTNGLGTSLARKVYTPAHTT